MAKIMAVITAGDKSAQAVLAAEALRKAAKTLGHEIALEIRTGQEVRTPLEADPKAAVLLVVGEGAAGEERFPGLKRNAASLAAVLSDATAVLRSALAPAASGKRIVAITSCPTGIAHTFMAAEGLSRAGAALGHQIKVETQGSVGAQNTLTDEEIAAADLVIIAADTKIDVSRFAGKRIFYSGTNQAINEGQKLIAQAFAEAGESGKKADLLDTVTAGKAKRKAQQTGAYKHLMTGVSFMIPFVVAGGLLIAIAFALGGIYAFDDAHKGTLAYVLFQIGGKGAFALMVPILAGYIAFSIADRPGLAPGMVGGMLSANLNAGFLGAIFAGFIAGYATQWLNKNIKLPRNLEGLKPVLILPVLGTLVTGLLMMYVVGTPVAELMAWLTAWLKGMQSGSAITLGILIGLMMAFDMGGPVNKAAYTFATGLIASQVYLPMAAAMAAGMTPPLGIALATKLFAGRFTADEREAGNAAAVLGISFITEGAIPFAARDPLRVIPSLMVGSAVAGAISMAVGAELKVPHGGIFVLPIPNAVTHLFGYIVALVVGTAVTAALLRIVKKPVEE